MEALLAFGVNWKLLLIQGVNFGLLFAVLHRFLYRPLFALLEKRQAIIVRGLKDAEEAALEKEKIGTEKEGLLALAREEGGKLMEGLRKQAIGEEKKILKSAQEKSAALLADARAKANDEHAYMLRESEKEVARMSVLAAEKILRSGY